VIFVPCLVMYFLYLKMWRTLQGYTGDCCGATFLLVELSVYLTICINLHNAMP
ncbi:MAG: adenosylcobinamide-GDP ribazoletransferase, partial [Prevotella sp.]|nr:adenosylcobinamide-GDP ribazoletransferase [Prevotella sp.]